MGHDLTSPNPWMLLPFGLLLAGMALAPWLCSAWWNKHYAKPVCGLGALTLGYYLFGLHAGDRVLHTARDYTGFMALIGSLFVVSGGIHLRVQGEATPRVNVVFLLVGGILANILGTTGASMLLIRPWLRLNQYRVTAYHVVFFIFIVANVGGCLTPIGDPPLFLGYLQGIPFWWVAERCWPFWLLGMTILLAMFYLVDRHNYLRAPKSVRERLAEPADRWWLEGGANLLFLALILVATFIPDPPLLREGLMIAAAAGSYFTTGKSVHEANHFNFHPIVEVAVLFAGIFATMLPALDWLALHAGQAGRPGPTFFYWATGTLSSVLDNAPTYLSFLSVLFGSAVDPDTVNQIRRLVQTGGAHLATGSESVRQTLEVLQTYHGAHLAAGRVRTEEIQIACLLGDAASSRHLVALSIGAVFFGANTYIGNGPNFMVKAIADHQKVHTPTFLGFVFRYTLPCMLPMLLIVWWALIRR